MRYKHVSSAINYFKHMNKNASWSAPVVCPMKVGPNRSPEILVFTWERYSFFIEYLVRCPSLNSRRGFNQYVINVVAQRGVLYCNISKMNSPRCLIDSSCPFAIRNKCDVCLVDNITVQW